MESPVRNVNIFFQSPSTILYKLLSFFSATCGVSNCSGRGACLTLSEINQQYTYGNAVISNFTLWEGNHTTACVCQPGYSGANCEYSESHFNITFLCCFGHLLCIFYPQNSVRKATTQ